jgi:hypothetical protein
MEDVLGILLNPVHGYGRLLDPSEVVVARVTNLNVELAERQKTLGRALTLDELGEEFTVPMDDLVAQGLCQHIQDVPSIISKERWLSTQQQAIQRLVEGKEVL